MANTAFLIRSGPRAAGARRPRGTDRASECLCLPNEDSVALEKRGLRRKRQGRPLTAAVQALLQCLESGRVKGERPLHK